MNEKLEYLLLGFVLSSCLGPYAHQAFRKIVIVPALFVKNAWWNRNKRKQINRLQAQLDEARKYFNDKTALTQALLAQIISSIALIMLNHLFTVYSPLIGDPVLIEASNLLVVTVIYITVITKCAHMLDIYIWVKNFEKHEARTERAISELKQALGEN